MSKVKVEFTVTPKNLAAYLLDVGLDNVVLINGKGSILLEKGQTHTVVWRMRGNAGGTIGISYRSKGSDVVLVKESKIRDGKISGFGYKDFSI